MALGSDLIPNQWYDITFQCVTPTCKFKNIIKEINPTWSNGGDITNAIICQPCGQFCEIVTATYLDPQPIVP